MRNEDNRVVISCLILCIIFNFILLVSSKNVYANEYNEYKYTQSKYMDFIKKHGEAKGESKKVIKQIHPLVTLFFDLLRYGFLAYGVYNLVIAAFKIQKAKKQGMGDPMDEGLSQIYRCVGGFLIFLLGPYIGDLVIGAVS